MNALPSTTATGAARVESTRSRSRPSLLRGLLVVVCGAAVVGSAFMGEPAPYLEADPELARLLRGMALLKGSVVCAALAGLLWRFGRPISLGLGFAYVAGAAIALGASVLIWNLEHLVAAAVLFHAAAGALIVSALFDRSNSCGPASR